MADITYQLKHPVQVGSETVTELKIRPMKPKHLRNLSVDPKSYTMGTIMDLAAKLTGQPSVVFDEMDMEDWEEVSAIVGERFAGGQSTGEKS